MKNKNANNRCHSGFSLVELIVTVLIMAIIAVALAPQVVKWIDNSRLASDVKTRDDIKDACALALTDTDAFNRVKDGGYVITVTKDSTGATSYVYDDSTGHDITPNTSDAFWHSLLETEGCSSFSDFEDKFKLKSTVSEGSIILKVKVYESGHTIAVLSGITGNDDIEVVTDVEPSEG